MSYLFWVLIAAMLMVSIAIVALPFGPGKRLTRSPLILLVALVPLTAIGLYVALGTPAAIGDSPDPAHRGKGNATAANNAGSGSGIPTVASLINGLETRLQQESDDGRGWLLLARSYDHLGRHAEARIAYARATELGENFPELEKSLFGADAAQAVGNVDKSAAIRGRLTLSPEAAVQVISTDTIFIFAKESLEQRMPVAALRKSVADLPLDFELTDEQAMVPGKRIADFEQLIVSATISRSGKAGDTLNGFTAASAPVSPSGNDSIELQITLHAWPEGLNRE